MCTLVLSIGQHPDWPLLLAANRDEMLDRTWLPPACHWPQQPDVLAGRDVLAGGTWLGVNRAGVVAAVLNRAGSLGPAQGKESRGELPLMALLHATARDAARAMAKLDAGRWRSFNLVIADRDGAVFLRGTGQGPVSVHRLDPGIHMVTARESGRPGEPARGPQPTAVPQQRPAEPARLVGLDPPAGRHHAAARRRDQRGAA